MYVMHYKAGIIRALVAQKKYTLIYGLIKHLQLETHNSLWQAL